MAAGPEDGGTGAGGLTVSEAGPGEAAGLLEAGLPAGPAGPDPVPGSGAGRRARRWAAAIAAVVLLGGAGLAVWTWAGGPAGVPGQPARVPRYYVQQVIGQRPPPVTVVRATATGAVTATVRSPWPQAHIAAIAAGGDQTFFMVCQRPAGSAANSALPQARIYRFRVTAAGRVSGYSLVPGGMLPGLQDGGLAVSADDSQLAVTVAPGAAASGPSRTAIMVINARTGARARWRVPPAVPGKMTFSAGDPSFTADGRELAFLAIPRCVQGPCRPTGSGEEVRAVSPAGQGGSLASSRVLLRQSSLTSLGTGYLDGAVVSPDGSNVTVLVMNGPARGQLRTTISVVRVSAATGRQTGVSYRVDTGNGFSYRLFGSDPSGRYLLLNAGPTSGMVNGWIDHGRLIQLTPANGDNVLSETW